MKRLASVLGCAELLWIAYSMFRGGYKVGLELMYRLFRFDLLKQVSD